MWDGSFLLCQLLSSLPLMKSRIVELGCGTGLCGIYAALKGAEVVLTDRYTDLAQLNSQLIENIYHANLALRVLPLDWESPYEIDVGDIDLIIGAEIAVLKKQQHHLCAAIDALAGPKTIILLTFDNIPQPNNVAYETDMCHRMKSLGFLAQHVLTGRVQWQNYLENNAEFTGIENTVDSINLCLPPMAKDVLKRTYATLEMIHEETYAETQSALRNDALQLHHVTAFFRRTAGNTCSRCHCYYLHVVNSMNACQFHPGFFVCRRHPAEISCSISGYGDGLGYYGNGTQGTKGVHILRNIYYCLICRRMEG